MTINRILNRAGLASVIYQQANLKQSYKARKARRDFAKVQKFWKVTDWQRVIFTDECDVLPRLCGRLRVRKTIDETVELAADQTKGNIGIKVWGAISSEGLDPWYVMMVLLQGISIEILNDHLITDYPQVVISRANPQSKALIFQDDNAGPHRASIVTQWKKGHCINSLPTWPAPSPDLSIIENVWSYLEDRLYSFRNTLNTSEDTWEKVQKIWYSIPTDYIQSLYRSLPDRMITTIDNHGTLI